MTQFEFDILLEKYMDGRCSLEEERIVENWHARVTELDKNLLTEEEQDFIETDIWKKLKRNTLPQKKYFGLFSFRFYGIAASLVFLVCMGCLFFKGTIFNGETPAISKTDIEIRNTSGKEQTINLSDGSEVVLDPGSILSYPESFGQKARQVYLQGKGFFKVKKDPERPFRVLSGKLVAEALGTSFIVNAKEENTNIEVIVVTGKVAVYDEVARKNNVVPAVSTIITRNQAAVYNKENQNVTTKIAENPQAYPVYEGENTSVVPTNFIFEDKQLSYVFEQFKKVYGLDFILENESLKKCEITADLEDLPMFSQIKLICESINAKYRIEGTRVLVSGKGCK
jgi:transmembrane sensor